MIKNKDRSGWFGASDTHYITGNFDTKTFSKWWLIKLGAIKPTFSNKFLNAGTYYEHPVLRSIGADRMDRQIKIRKLRLRVNLDGEKKGIVYEVKTHKQSNGFRLKKEYYKQAQVQMFATKTKRLCIVSYGLLPEDYSNFFNHIDTNRLGFHWIDYDPEFTAKWLLRITYLKDCLKRRSTPNESEYKRLYCDDG